MCNSLESGIRMTTPEDKFGVGKSVFGCNDMVGNVWEWTGSRYDEDGYILRGGTWYFNDVLCRCEFRTRLDPFKRGLYLGFRCTRT
jgi:formylglycine-generating enzyme required for sulfatase activity